MSKETSERAAQPCGDGMCWARSLEDACDHWKAEVERLQEELRIARWDAGVPIREMREENERLRNSNERLARWLHERDGATFIRVPWDDESEGMRVEYRKLADEALSAPPSPGSGAASDG